MAKPSFEQWKRQTLGQKIDLDNSSYDCVDVAKSWAEFLTGKPWTQSLSWGDAADIWFNVPGTYWERRSDPALGSVVCMNSLIGGGYGHIGVVVGIDGGNIIIYQQNTFTQQAVYTGVYSSHANYIQGYLYPKVDFTLNDQPILAGYQRVVGNDNGMYRKSPNRSAELMITDAIPDGKLKAGEVYDFRGFVRGENVGGNNIWFVGSHTGGYGSSTVFTDTGTHDLADLTPADLQPTQRQIGSDPMNLRRSPQVAPDNVIRVLSAGEVHEYDGYIKGMIVDGSNIWLRHKDTGGYVWSQGFTDTSTHDLPEIVVDTPTQTVPLTYPSPTEDSTVTAVYNKKHPVGADYVPTDLVNVSGGQQLRQEAAASLSLMQIAASTNNATLICASGYRSYQTQQTVYSQYVAKDGQAAADTYSARPGFSEHQTGLAMDFGPIEDSFKTSTASSWLLANAYKYGWVLRYPEGKTTVTGYTYEPWHWRYIGVTAAVDAHDKGVSTLEEYYNVGGGGYVEPNQGPSTNKDNEQDARLMKLEELVKKIQDFLASVFNNIFRRG